MKGVRFIENEIRVCLPTETLSHHFTHPLINHTSLHSIGFYPNAKNHYVHREEGIEEYILAYCIAGEGSIKLPFKDEITLTQGDAHIIKPHTPHIYYASDHDPWSILWMHFTLPKQNLLDQQNLHVDNLSTTKDARIQKHFKLLLTYARSELSVGNLICISKTLELLLADLILREDLQVSNSNYLTEAIMFMRKNLHKRLTLLDIAESVGISETHLAHLFKDEAQESPINYFISLKIEEAKRLLNLTDMSIKDISFELGYQDPFYFSRLFKQITNQSPRSFRKNTRFEFSNADTNQEKV